MAPLEEPVRKRARVAHGPAVLAAIISGESLEDIAQSRNISLKRVEKILRNELHKRWIAPAQEYARLQIARLEYIATLLKQKAKDGDLPTIDRLLKVLDRLDRYHGFNKLVDLSAQSDEDVRARLALRVEQASRMPDRLE